MDNQAYGDAYRKMIGEPLALGDSDFAALRTFDPALEQTARQRRADARGVLIEKEMAAAPVVLPTPAPTRFEGLGTVIATAIRTAMVPLIARVAALEQGNTSKKDLDAVRTQLDGSIAARAVLENHVATLQRDLDAARAQIAELKAAPPPLRIAR